MQRFSQIFKLNVDQPQLDFVDIIPSFDNPLFIDPFALSLKEDVWSKRCHQHISHFFQTALDHIRAGRKQQASRLLNGLSEPNETCLGVSKGGPAGRGVAGKQALDLYDSIAASQAAKSGLLEELAECDLFVPGIGSDKISDITTNIIRKLLIEYTQAQCALHNIPLVGTYPTGRYWDMASQSWGADYATLPVIGNKRIILVPKHSVRLRMSLVAQEYYSHHILNFIQAEEYASGSTLVRVLKNGETRPPSKKSLREKFPFSKDFVARFSEANPTVLEDYKRFYSKLRGADGTLSNADFDETFDETVLARALMQRLSKIPAGRASEAEYHSFVIGCLEFVFWPHLIYPIKEDKIHDGRKRIDVTYTNAAKDGVFFRAHSSHQISSTYVMVECKNYNKEVNNPELDQLSGRFSVNRGKLGLLLYRQVADYSQLMARCKDTANDGRGFILPIGDEQLLGMLDDIACDKRHMVDKRLESILSMVVK